MGCISGVKPLQQYLYLPFAEQMVSPSSNSRNKNNSYTDQTKIFLAKVDVLCFGDASVLVGRVCISAPTTQYVVAMAKLFHVSSDYMLGMESALQLSLDGYTPEETRLIFDLIKYFDQRR